MSGLSADALFEQMARSYVEQYGKELGQELEELEKHEIPAATPSLDRRVHRAVYAPARRRNMRILGALAACLVLVLLVPRLMSLQLPESAGEAQSSAVAEDAAPQESAMPNEDLLLIPLSFELPDNLSVENSELDNGKTIYYLHNTQLDDVVMTLEKTTAENVAHDGLVEIQINQSTAYGMSGPDYNLLTFQKEDIAYVLTCEHDINTLIGLSKHIL